MDFFIDVVIPLAVPKTFTYRVTADEFNFIEQGFRVAVPFGKRTIYTGVVFSKHQEKPQTYEPKEIFAIIDEQPTVTTKQLELWQWISTYYMCTLGEVFRAALPSIMLLESETLLTFNSESIVASDTLDDEEFLLYEAFQSQAILRLDEVREILNKKNVFDVIDRLLEKKIVTLNKHLQEKYKPKLVKYVRLNERFKEEKQLQELLSGGLRSDKHRALILKYFQLERQHKPITVKNLLNEVGVSSAVYKTVERKGIFETYTLVKDRIQFKDASTNSVKLSKEQQSTFESIQKQFLSKNVVLLQGVTGSGKTEIYIQSIQKIIDKEQQVLFLVPEIGLTTQLVQRLISFFGNKIAVYNSRYSENERVEIYHHVLNQHENAQIVIGSRASIFLPFRNLGLIVVDEEHDASFKQNDPAPRYHARDVAIVLAKQLDTKVLLGSATPSLESYYNAYQEKYGYATLTRRYANLLLPKMELIDLKEARKRKELNGFFSIKLIDSINEALYQGEQVLLFQNRRGFAPVLECLSCGHVPHCTSCDVSLTYYKRSNHLKCHYCGFVMAMPTNCHACYSRELSTKGLGTEQIEEALRELFPNKKIARMDQDTMRGKFAFEKLMDTFKNQEIDVLVGTQMMAKGLDFDNVSLVGIMNADTMLSFPDFRAHERAFQLMIQIAGRSGRRNKQGKVIVQTYNPYHNTIQQVIRNDFQAMFKEQMYERLNFKYPPFYRLIHLQLKHVNFEKVMNAAEWLATHLRSNLVDILVLGPQEPAVNRIKNQYIQVILVKLPVNKPSNIIKKSIQRSLQSMETIGNFRPVKVTVSVDYY